MSKTKTYLSLKDKIEIIRAYDQDKPSARALANQFNIGKTQAANIINKRETILQKWVLRGGMHEKRGFFKPEGLNIDKMCYEWYLDAREQNLPVTGTLIRSKAKEIARQLKYDNFKASSGWLEKFKKRHNIQFRTSGFDFGTTIKTEDPSNFAHFLEGFECNGEVFNPASASAMLDNLANQAAFKPNDRSNASGENVNDIKVEPDINLGMDPLGIKCEDGTNSSDSEDTGMEGGINTYKEARNALKKLKAFALKTKDLKGFQLSMALQMHFENVAVMREYFGKEC